MPPQLNTTSSTTAPSYTTTGLSDLDKAYLVTVYTRPKPHSSASQWTLAYALDKLGITDGDITDSLANASTFQQRRQDLAIWIASEMASNAAKGGPESAPAAALDADDDDDADGDLEKYGWCNDDDPVIDPPEIADTSSDDVPVDGGPQSAAAILGTTLWTPGQTIVYKFQQEGKGFEHRQKQFKYYLKKYLENVNLDIIEDSDLISDMFDNPKRPAPPAVHYVYFGTKPDYKHSRSWCKRGRRALGWTNPRQDVPERGEKGGMANTTFYISVPPNEQDAGSEGAQFESRRYQHEMGHLFGLIHEQDNPNSKLKKKKIDPLTGYYTFFDMSSIMLYSKLEGYDPTASPTPWNIKPSTYDKAFLTVSPWTLLASYFVLTHIFVGRVYILSPVRTGKLLFEQHWTLWVPTLLWLSTTSSMHSTNTSRSAQQNG